MTQVYRVSWKRTPSSPAARGYGPGYGGAPAARVAVEGAPSPPQAALQAEAAPIECKYINREQATKSQKHIGACQGGIPPSYSPLAYDADLAREMPLVKSKAEHCKIISEAAAEARVSASIFWLVWRSRAPTLWLRFEVIAVLCRAGESR
ncbi:hypothetical protein [Actinomadura geliboluensis]|uniref:Uncharacterized protein n=1 Tax=Actinomadura geliboluensis TaxID=882440 RepID=A0A5S4GXA5_9ACTN|nr:hypothetical protein [Actinomadura geliboluensis]TMR37546.1 hypothetical protein ETD96_18230 [Actinomadura geliboluensis]